MAKNDDKFVQKLIAESRKLVQVNSKKIEAEETLRELTMFRNFSSVIQSGDSRFDKVFRISMKVVPNGVASCAGTLSPAPHEVAVISVHNISDTFAFNPRYWQFVIDLEGGESVSAFTIERTLLPGASETFCTAFSTDCSITPVQINVKLVFSLNFKSRNFVRTINLRRLLIDILHLLNPGRISLSQMYDNTLSPSESTNFSHLYQKTSQEDKGLSAVTQFFLHFDLEMLRHFMHHIILNDSLARGLGYDAIQDLNSSTPSLRVYYQAEEIAISAKPKGSGVVVSFKSSNSMVLFALRISILRRLMCMSNVKVSCPDDSICEQLYDFKLRVEDLGRVSDSGDIEIADFMDVYLELRNISEMIQFILIKDVE